MLGAHANKRPFYYWMCTSTRSHEATPLPCHQGTIIFLSFEGYPTLFSQEGWESSVSSIISIIVIRVDAFPLLTVFIIRVCDICMFVCKAGRKGGREKRQREHKREHARECHSMPVEVRGQLLRVGSFLPLWALGIELLSGLHSKLLYLLSHPTGPHSLISTSFMFKLSLTSLSIQPQWSNNTHIL